MFHYREGFNYLLDVSLTEDAEEYFFPQIIKMEPVFWA